jgi:hypothetical protein
MKTWLISGILVLSLFFGITSFVHADSLPGGGSGPPVLPGPPAPETPPADSGSSGGGSVEVVGGNGPIAGSLTAPVMPILPTPSPDTASSSTSTVTSTSSTSASPAIAPATTAPSADTEHAILDARPAPQAPAATSAAQVAAAAEVGDYALPWSLFILFLFLVGWWVWDTPQKNP